MREDVKEAVDRPRHRRDANHVIRFPRARYRSRRVSPRRNRLWWDRHCRPTSATLGLSPCYAVRRSERYRLRLGCIIIKRYKGRRARGKKVVDHCGRRAFDSAYNSRSGPLPLPFSFSLSLSFFFSRIFAESALLSLGSPVHATRPSVSRDHQDSDAAGINAIYRLIEGILPSRFRASF